MRTPANEVQSGTHREHNRYNYQRRWKVTYQKEKDIGNPAMKFETV